MQLSRLISTLHLSVGSQQRGAGFHERSSSCGGGGVRTHTDMRMTNMGEAAVVEQILLDVQ
ncbi:hypothetical protein [Bradyrhizobium cenepequi]|uniref:hypothetical protein n=1 Tax=Bradyrhizobium cenepequi TaxID=2821403 RepID=UPI001CE34BE0|nr:hypothetical protein [Bradyrhizobium cenepequi]MCA6107969.1 hypothetical protein [Bradyrhizobium cenepequi]